MNEYWYVNNKILLPVTTTHSIEHYSLYLAGSLISLPVRVHVGGSLGVLEADGGVLSTFVCLSDCLIGVAARDGVLFTLVCLAGCLIGVAAFGVGGAASVNC